MTHPPTGLLIQKEHCVGCLACSRTCPEAAILVTDRGARREIRFQSGCRERDCDRCVAACPEQALARGAAAGAGAAPPLTLEFALRPCLSCARPIATNQVLARVLERTSAQLNIRLPARDWVELCPVCRRREQSLALVEGIRANRPRP